MQGLHGKNKLFPFLSAFLWEVYFWFNTSSTFIYEQNNEVYCCCLYCWNKFHSETNSVMNVKVVLTSSKKIWFNTTRFPTMLHLWWIFHRKFHTWKPYFISLHITLNNLIPIDKINHLKGTISLGHCRVHNCIILVFNFDSFYENHWQLLSENLMKRTGFLLSKNDEPEIKIFDCTPLGDHFGYLRLQGTITLSTDRKYNIPQIDIRFDGWYQNSDIFRTL